MSDFLDGGLPGWPGWRTDNVERLYPLWTPGDPAGRSDFYTGTTPDGFQRIMGPWDGRINVCVCFLANGTPDHVQLRTVPDPSPEGCDPESDWDREYGWGLRQALAWQAELGWRDGLVRVRRFMLKENPIYISDYPPWAIRYLADPIYCHAPNERASVAKEVCEWEANGCFVFWWGKSYFMNKEGEVIAT